MAKILSIIILIALIGGGAWYYTNKIQTPAEGTPVAFETSRSGLTSNNNDTDEKFNKNFIKITFPNTNSTLIVGEKVKTTWDGRTNFDFKLTYPVTLIDVNNKDKKPVDLGIAKNSLFNKVFDWTVPAATTPGSYKIVFGGKLGGESEVFRVASSTATTPIKIIIPTIEKIFSNISIINSNDRYNYDKLSGIKMDIGLNFTSKGGDIFASGTTAVVGIKDKQTGQILATTTVNITPSESGLNIFQEGATKVVYISTVFGTSTFPLKNMIVSSFVQSIIFSPVVKDPSRNRVMLNSGLETLSSDNVITITTTSNPTTPSTGTTTPPASTGGGGGGGGGVPSPLLFTRNLVMGNSGADVTALQQILLTKGFSNIAPTGYFGETTKSALKAYQVSIGISPADGYFGPMTRAILNSEIVTR